MDYKISIDNLNSGEILTYPAIIVKGHVDQGTDCCGLPPADCIELQSEKFKVVNWKFKILCELKLGENHLEIKYCCQSLSITLTYRPNTSRYSVLPLYIICDGHNGDFQAPQTESNDTKSACNRIVTCCKLLQSIFADIMYEEGYGRKSFNLDDHCAIFRSKLNYLNVRGMKQEEIWTKLGNEILNSPFDADNQKFLGFLSCTQYQGDKYSESIHKSHDDFLEITQAYVALGGGGFALFGTACMYTWPEHIRQVITKFQDTNPIDKMKFLDDSCYRGTHGGCFSTTLGSLLHELCHCFDLGHTSDGIMGRGFDNIHKIFIDTPKIESNRTEKVRFLQGSSIDFKEKIDRQLFLSEKLEEKPKQYSISKKIYRFSRDDVFFTKSCLMILAYHRWFNDFTNVTSNAVLKYDYSTQIITSTAGLRVVEIRNESDGFVRKSWTFADRILKYSFQLPEDTSTTDLVVMVEDNFGNILKQRTDSCSDSKKATDSDLRTLQ